MIYFCIWCGAGSDVFEWNDKRHYNSYHLPEYINDFVGDCPQCGKQCHGIDEIRES